MGLVRGKVICMGLKEGVVGVLWESNRCDHGC